MLKNFIKNNSLKAQTHSGNFHCDDVFAAALLQMYCEFYDVDFILERNDTISKENQLFFDVGFKHDPENGWFDHHQDNDDSILHNFKKPNGELIQEKRSAFGLLWQYIGETFLQGRANWVFDTQFVSKIDHFDNYGGNDTLSIIIKDMNHIDLFARNGVTLDDRFNQAVEMAKTILNAKICVLRDSHLYMAELFKYAESDEVKQSGIVVTDMYISGMNSAIGNKCPWVDFFISPSGRGDSFNLFPIYKDKVGTPKINIINNGKAVFSTDRFMQFENVEDAIECAKHSQALSKKEQ